MLSEEQKILLLKREAPRLISEMIKAGYTDNEIYLSLPQFVFETGYFTNTGYKYNNPAGLTYSVNQKDSTQGPPRPPSEGGFYSAFTSLQPALKLHLNTIRKIKKRGNTLPVPATAKTFTEFARLLYANGYYTGTPANATPLQKVNNYAKGLIDINKRIEKAGIKKKI
jgi:hypothetical protein